MGFDFHAMHFLRHVGKRGGLGDTVTIARQEIHLNALALGGIIDLKPGYRHEAFCENLLAEYFGATKTHSVDASSFEGATHVHDLNVPLPEHLHGLYDTVIDSGCIEHVYNAPQALKNCSLLCREGGQIVHILPANNFCGHGFWQFSPELFFSLYSEQNGYRDTEVYVADYVDKTAWFRVHRPQGGRRANIMSSSEIYVMVRTTRAGPTFSHEVVQQSDYAYEWEAGDRTPQPVPTPSGAKGWIMGNPLIYRVLFPLYHRLQRATSKERMRPANPALERIPLP